MATPDYWVARCHVVANAPEARHWDEEADEAIVSVAVLAESEDDVRALLQSRLSEDGLSLLKLEAAQTLLERFRHQGMSQTLVELAHQTSSKNRVVYGEMLPLVAEPTPVEPVPVEPPLSLTETTWQALQAPDQPPLWAVVDGVNCREIQARLGQTDAQHTCLYASTNAETRANAPWLVRLEADSDIRVWLENLPQDQHWGVLFHSHATLKQLRTHLRKYTMLWTPNDDQAPVYFRFYDPRVALDMTQALAPWKLAAFMAPLETVITPVSPLMAFPSDLTLDPPVALDAQAGEVQGRLAQVSLSNQARDACRQGRQFAIGQQEFDRFGALMQQRAQAGLALALGEQYPRRLVEERLSAVQTAAQLGQRYGLASKRQVRTLAKCVIEFGNSFPAHQAEAWRILENPKTAAWRKRDRLEAWLPRGRVQRVLRRPDDDEASMQHDNFRPIVNGEQS